MKINNIGSAALFFIVAFSQVDVLASELVEKEELLRSGKSWEGTSYGAYPEGSPVVTFLRVNVAPNQVLGWHYHPCMSTVYMVSGSVKLDIQGEDISKIFSSGDIFNDTVNIVHRGTSGSDGAEMLVFFACDEGKPLTVSSDSE